MKIIYRTENQVEADLICGKFTEYGIPSKQLKESLGRSLGLQYGILGQIAIAVDKSRVSEAEALLNDHPEK